MPAFQETTRPRDILVTGGTGFIGSHLAVRLLELGHRVHWLIRPHASSAERRMETMLERLVEDRALRQLYLSRSRALSGNIQLPNMGLPGCDRAALPVFEEVWHSAASLSFQEGEREEIFRTNLAGTKNLMAWLEQTPSRRVNFVSTAYIAGRRQGRVLESEIFTGQEFKNPYEESKCLSELFIRECEARAGFQSTIFRPSVVIGRSDDGKITHFHGVYGFIKGLATALCRINLRKELNGLIELPLRIVGAASKTLNMVPVDYVIDAMISIGVGRNSLGKTYHVVNPVPPENRVWLRELCRTLGVTGVRFVADHEFQNSPMTFIEKLFSRKMAFYAQYLDGEPVFDTTNLGAALQGTGIECPRLDKRMMQMIIQYYLQLLDLPRHVEA
ncbi:MAG: SDR family oxidoreductase [Acidobacteriota bacterium]